MFLHVLPFQNEGGHFHIKKCLKNALGLACPNRATQTGTQQRSRIARPPKEMPSRRARMRCLLQRMPWPGSHRAPWGPLGLLGSQGARRLGPKEPQGCPRRPKAPPGGSCPSLSSSGCWMAESQLQGGLSSSVRTPMLQKIAHGGCTKPPSILTAFLKHALARRGKPFF